MESSDTRKICPVCQKEIEETEKRICCPVCGTDHHEACWQAHGGCGAAGCSKETQAPPPAGPVCSQCGTPLTGDQAFCSKCGASQAGGDVCQRCGTALHGQAFCPQCGQKAGAAVSAPVPQPPKKKTPLLIVGAVVVVAILAAVIFLMKKPEAALVSNMTADDLEAGIADYIDDEISGFTEETGAGGLVLRHTVDSTVVDISVEAQANADRHISQITFTNGGVNMDAYSSQSELLTLLNDDPMNWTMSDLSAAYTVLEVIAVYEAAGGDLEEVQMRDVCDVFCGDTPLKLDGWMITAQLDEGAEEVTVNAVYQG